MMHDGKKKTHVISVGDPSGINYSYDLDQATLLQVWRGDFLNVTEMWYERGEPQVASSMGAAISFKGKSVIGIVTDNKAPLPDTLNDRTDLLYKGYSLDGNGYPTFNYTYKTITLKDSFVPLPMARGINHVISLSNTPSSGTLLIRLGEGKEITEVSENIYALDDQRYYIKFIPSGNSKPFIRTVADKKELVISVSAGSSSQITYSLLW
jgi:hypothetical protein